jgi:uncharacterized protein (TIGR03382 family)
MDAEFYGAMKWLTVILALVIVWLFMRRRTK